MESRVPLIVLLATVPLAAHATGQGPACGLATPTPTLGQGAWSLDVAAIIRITPEWMCAAGPAQFANASWPEYAAVAWEAAWRRWDGIDPPASEEDTGPSVELEW